MAAVMKGVKNGDQKVPDPVRGRRNGHAYRAVADGLEGRGLAPGHGAPGASEGGDEKAGEDDHDDACRGRPRRIDPVQGEMADASEHDETHGHP